METLVERLRIRASIRRTIKERRSVQEGKPDRIADLLEEAANSIEPNIPEFEVITLMDGNKTIALVAKRV
jgi:hypothetical protein